MRIDTGSDHTASEADPHTSTSHAAVEDMHPQNQEVQSQAKLY